jgi:hypothetical protein
MKRYSSAAVLALAVLTVLSLANSVSAGDPVPFKGSFEGDVTVTPLAPPNLAVDVEATGNAILLGLFTLDIPHVVNPVTHTAKGSYEFTAANGDTLTAHFTGVAMLIAPGILYIEESATITGGTGRFAGATGSFTSDRLYDMLEGTTTGSFEGTITLDDDADD